MTTTTALEALSLSLIRDEKASFFDDGLEANSCSYTDTFVDDIVHNLGISEKAAGGVISSMVQKGLFKTDSEGGIYLTQAGVESASNSGAN